MTGNWRCDKCSIDLGWSKSHIKSHIKIGEVKVGCHFRDRRLVRMDFPDMSHISKELIEKEISEIKRKLRKVENNTHQLLLRLAPKFVTLCWEKSRFDNREGKNQRKFHIIPDFMLKRFGTATKGGDTLFTRYIQVNDTTFHRKNTSGDNEYALHFPADSAVDSCAINSPITESILCSLEYEINEYLKIEDKLSESSDLYRSGRDDFTKPTLYNTSYDKLISALFIATMLARVPKDMNSLNLNLPYLIELTMFLLHKAFYMNGDTSGSPVPLVVFGDGEFGSHWKISRRISLTGEDDFSIFAAPISPLRVLLFSSNPLDEKTRIHIVESMFKTVDGMNCIIYVPRDSTMTEEILREHNIRIVNCSGKCPSCRTVLPDNPTLQQK